MILSFFAGFAFFPKPMNTAISGAKLRAMKLYCTVFQIPKRLRAADLIGLGSELFPRVFWWFGTFVSVEQIAFYNQIDYGISSMFIKQEVMRLAKYLLIFIDKCL